jgi:hypothetical protein
VIYQDGTCNTALELSDGEAVRLGRIARLTAAAPCSFGQTSDLRSDSQLVGDAGQVVRRAYLVNWACIADLRTQEEAEALAAGLSVYRAWHLGLR